MPLGSSKLKWAWQAHFLSYDIVTLQNYLSLEGLQMILVALLDFFSSLGFGKNGILLFVHP